jgi:hypothetical protein
MSTVSNVLCTVGYVLGAACELAGYALSFCWALLRNHLEVSWTMNFFTVRTLGFQVLHILLVFDHRSEHPDVIIGECSGNESRRCCLLHA